MLLFKLKTHLDKLLPFIRLVVRSNTDVKSNTTNALQTHLDEPLLLIRLVVRGQREEGDFATLPVIQHHPVSKRYGIASVQCDCKGWERSTGPHMISWCMQCYCRRTDAMALMTFRCNAL